MTRKLKVQHAKETPTTHFRLCHLCLFLNESEGAIAECEACQCAFISDLAWDTGAQERARLEAELEEEMEEGVLRSDKRLTGLSVVW